jgi:hypothetical protein
MERAVTNVQGRYAIYPGIDIDIPIEPAQCSREGVWDAVRAAFAGGAQGVVLSRKWSETQLDHLAGASDAIRELAVTQAGYEKGDGYGLPNGRPARTV